MASMGRGHDWMMKGEKNLLVESITKDYEIWLAVTGGLILFFLGIAVVLFWECAIGGGKGR